MLRVLQTDPGLCEEIRLYGCNFRSLLAIPEEVMQIALTRGQIQQAYDELSAIPEVMSKKCVMGQALAMVPRWGFQAIGSQKHASQIGIAWPGARFEFWPSARILTILKGVMHEAGFQGRTEPTAHFRLGDRAGRLIWDPAGAVPIIREDSILFYQVY